MMNTIRTSLIMLIVAIFLVSCASSGINDNNSGTFRGRWYNYYGRGIEYSAGEDWVSALHELRKAASRRDRDQRMARTYGFHFIDYFPHREIGIALLEQGMIDEAIHELEKSISEERSAKAVFYLNKARKQFLKKQDRIIAPPVIVINTPIPYESLNSFSKVVSGRATGNGYIAKITVNGTSYKFDLAEQEIEFEVKVNLAEETDRIVVIAEDLLGSSSAKAVEINIDREGPVISILDIVEEKRNNINMVRVTGSVKDSTGISRLSMNNEFVSVKNSKDHQFDIKLDRATLPSPFTIKAYDALDNVTTAAIDIEKELMALDCRDEPIMLAMQVTDLFSSDSSPPVISLKDSTSIPPVFVETYYVEGEASDNRKVESIYVNNRSILSGKGKKIFFAKIVKLDEGQNNINVEALDSSGNSSEAAFNVTRKIPEVLQVGSRMTMSILPFDMEGGESSAEYLAHAHLTGSFVNQKRFNIVEREKLEQVLLEQKLTRDQLTDPDYSIKVGRLMASDTILSTSATISSKSVEITSRVINTETSEIMDVEDVYSENISLDSIKDLMDGLASKVAGSFPLIEGMVIKNDNKFIFTTLGTEIGIKGEMGIILYRPGEEVHHPLTGKYLGRDMETLGVAVIKEVHEGFSKAKLTDGNGDITIKAQDMVITR